MAYSIEHQTYAEAVKAAFDKLPRARHVGERLRFIFIRRGYGRQEGWVDAGQYFLGYDYCARDADGRPLARTEPRWQYIRLGHWASEIEYSGQAENTESRFTRQPE